MEYAVSFVVRLSEAVIDEIDEIINIQKIFMDVVSEIVGARITPSGSCSIA